MISESQAEDCERTLSENKYFGYRGIICVTSVTKIFLLI